MLYRVTLAQRVKVEIEAETPDEALKIAQEAVQKSHPVFEPDILSVKGIVK